MRNERRSSSEVGALERALVVLVGAGRVATGVAFLAAPERAADAWVGSSSTELGYLTRAVGGRDVAIGAGVLWSMRRNGSVTPWLAASVGSDLVDAITASLTLDGVEAKKSMGIGLGFASLGVAAIVAHRSS